MNKIMSLKFFSKSPRITLFLLIFILSGCESLSTISSSKPHVNVVCAVGPVAFAGYRTKAMHSETHTLAREKNMASYNKELGVAQISFSNREKYEICYETISKTLVRRDPSDTANFIKFDTNSLDTTPYHRDYNSGTLEQKNARAADKCAEQELEDKKDWHDSTKPVHHTATFVMDYSGRIYASTAFKKCIFHHSSYLSGEPVVAAGEMRVDNWDFAVNQQ